MVGMPLGETDVRALVTRAWDLGSLAHRYAAFVDRFGPCLERAGDEKGDDAAAFALRTRLVHDFRQFPFLDPDLPDDLVPEGLTDVSARRAAARELFDDLYRQLAPAAQRHFDRTTATARSTAPARARVPAPGNKDRGDQM
jgi:phenylacetic acid degradation operon negative regulatory protein